jgi:hypothetical protein
LNGKKNRVKVSTTSTMEFLKNNYPNFPDIDLKFFLVKFLPSAIVGSHNVKIILKKSTMRSAL